ncbi:hypothetical protein HOD83_02500 [Candidatus Woesearchaeota archaeon]|nr:hypothetical protein [Candidatus Woesearchaeota archaeon]MBT4114120.1 hypothetical protein [Candidatus Woesearchaeota archaeon]MBT4248437.1 hypothetical protein [Candidatus Woesearchaeota archaeon]
MDKDNTEAAASKNKDVGVKVWHSNLPRPPGYEEYKFPCKIDKPWGWERWLELWHDPELRRGYCMKHLFIKKGTRTSLQRHKLKIETNFLIQGKVEAYLENEAGEMEMRIMEAGNPTCDTWTIPTDKTHRIYALTDIYLVEASTHDVDDVTRMADDSGRGSGKIDSEHDRAKE